MHENASHGETAITAAATDTLGKQGVGLVAAGADVACGIQRHVAAFTTDPAGNANGYPSRNVAGTGVRCTETGTVGGTIAPAVADTLGQQTIGIGAEGRDGSLG